MGKNKTKIKPNSQLLLARNQKEDSTLNLRPSYDKMQLRASSNRRP